MGAAHGRREAPSRVNTQEVRRRTVLRAWRVDGASETAGPGAGAGLARADTWACLSYPWAGGCGGHGSSRLDSLPVCLRCKHVCTWRGWCPEKHRFVCSRGDGATPLALAFSNARFVLNTVEQDEHINSPTSMLNTVWATTPYS
jgi:hypothetical protein